MRKLAVIVALTLFILSPSARAQSPSKKGSIEQTISALAEAYMARALGRLDAERLLFVGVKIIIEHSLAEDGAKDKYEVKSFKTFEKGEQWLRSRERGDGTPFRYVMPLLRCRKGLCTYNFDGGISHNHLYIEEVSYGFRNGRPYIKKIYLLDGD